jgi:hypothetical protein
VAVESCSQAAAETESRYSLAQLMQQPAAWHNLSKNVQPSLPARRLFFVRPDVGIKRLPHAAADAILSRR